ncbi:MAG: DUF2384 domain-containing protein [Proteobacteria bacterium]|nr:DUF2384 domain-containing protein [Pseudomonadota bacterium]
MTSTKKAQKNPNATIKKQKELNSQFKHALPSLSDESNRRKLAKMLISLFKRWQLDTASQLNLLGLSETSQFLLGMYAEGKEPLPDNRDTLDRVGWLLRIHKSLRLLYPKNESFRYDWVNKHNEKFDNLTPLDVMKTQGLLGVAEVARYLDSLKGR